MFKNNLYVILENFYGKIRVASYGLKSCKLNAIYRHIKSKHIVGG